VDWSQYDACGKCQAVAGDPCISLAPQHAGTVVALKEAHPKRPKVGANGHAPVTTLVPVQVDPDPIVVDDPTPEVVEPTPPIKRIRFARLRNDWVKTSCVATATFIGAVAAAVSYQHALDVSRKFGEDGWTAYLVPLTVDGLVYVSSMILLHAARNGTDKPKLAYFGLWLGIMATVAVNVTHGWTQGFGGALIAAWPAVTLVIVTHLLQHLFRKRS
jgi:uncharacterized protein DUF2637